MIPRAYQTDSEKAPWNEYEDEEPDPDYEYERAMEEEAEKMELWEQEAKAVCGVEE